MLSFTGRDTDVAIAGFSSFSASSSSSGSIRDLLCLEDSQATGGSLSIIIEEGQASGSLSGDPCAPARRDGAGSTGSSASREGEVALHGSPTATTRDDGAGVSPAPREGGEGSHGPLVPPEEEGQGVRSDNPPAPSKNLARCQEAPRASVGTATAETASTVASPTEAERDRYERDYRALFSLPPARRSREEWELVRFYAGCQLLEAVSDRIQGEEEIPNSLLMLAYKQI